MARPLLLTVSPEEFAFEAEYHELRLAPVLRVDAAGRWTAVGADALVGGTGALVRLFPPPGAEPPLAEQLEQLGRFCGFGFGLLRGHRILASIGEAVLPPLRPAAVVRGAESLRPWFGVETEAVLRRALWRAGAGRVRFEPAPAGAAGGRRDPAG